MINILVASDLHLGYLEKDPIRGEDSFVTFNEVFKIANERKVPTPPPPRPGPRIAVVLSRSGASRQRPRHTGAEHAPRQRVATHRRSTWC